MTTSVLIAGGGPAALEAALALRRLAGVRVATTVLAPEHAFTYRPLSVLAPFAAGEATLYPLERIASDAGFKHVRGRLRAVDTIEHTVESMTGERLGYDVLLVASGARPVSPIAGALTFTGSLADQERLHGLVQDVEAGYVRAVTFAVPVGCTWPLPLYELALLMAERAFDMGIAVDVQLFTPEPAPLAMFGDAAARELAALLRRSGIELHTAAAPPEYPGRVVTLPRIFGPGIPGLPADPEGFLPTDGYGRVRGAADVYAAGDVTSFPIKQGGIACQQADAAASHIAARAGAPVIPEPFEPVLRGLLVTERRARFLRRGAVAERPLWWPPAKIAGRELASYLERLDGERDRPPGMPVTVALETASVR